VERGAWSVGIWVICQAFGDIPGLFGFRLSGRASPLFDQGLQRVKSGERLWTVFSTPLIQHPPPTQIR